MKAQIASGPAVACDTVHNHSAGYFDVHFEANSFFYPLSLDIKYAEKSIDGQDCPSVIIGERHIPVNGRYQNSSKLFTTKFLASQIPNELLLQVLQE